jgi:hypothetical protein
MWCQRSRVSNWIFLSLYLQVAASLLIPSGARVSRSGPWQLYRSRIEPASEIPEVQQFPGKRVNTRVRDIICLLEGRIGSTETEIDANNRQKLNPKWTKTRNYLYHRTDLTVTQVLHVVQFLEDSTLQKTVIQTQGRICSCQAWSKEIHLTTFPSWLSVFRSFAR